MNPEQVLFDVGDAAPDVTIRDEDGNQVQLATFWQQQPVALVFVRHYG